MIENISQMHEALVARLPKDVVRVVYANALWRLGMRHVLRPSAHNLDAFRLLVTLSEAPSEVVEEQITRLRNWFETREEAVQDAQEKVTVLMRDVDEDPEVIEAARRALRQRNGKPVMEAFDELERVKPDPELLEAAPRDVVQAVVGAVHYQVFDQRSRATAQVMRSWSQARRRRANELREALRELCTDLDVYWLSLQDEEDGQEAASSVW